MGYTNFCCRSGGSNLNAGTRNGDTTEPGTSHDLEYASGTWVSATGVFTPASGDPSADGVQVGDYASIYADGASNTIHVAQVTAVTSTTITVSTTQKIVIGSGTSDGVLNRTLRIGGAWAGMSAGVIFPWNFVSSGPIPKFNFKNDQTYSITGALGSPGKYSVYEGYNTDYGDGGIAIIEGPTTGTTFVMATLSQQCRIDGFEFRQNGDTGTSAGVTVSISFACLRRVVVHDVAGVGISSTNDAVVLECEAYNCGLHTATGSAGISLKAGEAIRCISHHNAGTTGDGLFNTGSGAFVDCIGHNNGRYGFTSTSGSGAALRMYNCDSYDNGSDGAFIPTSNGTIVISSSNFFLNGGYGIGAGDSQKTGIVENCAFGSGDQANASGAIDTAHVDDQGILVVNSETFPEGVTPWTKPEEGDFRINSDRAINAARGNFTQTMSGFGGTTGYRARGAAQPFGYFKFRGGRADVSIHPKPILRSQPVDNQEDLGL